MKLLCAAFVAALLFPAAVYAAADVNGCDVILTPPDGATVVELTGPDDQDGEQLFDVFDGTVALTLDQGMQLASGRYTATWDTGEVEHFTLSCDETFDPDPSPEPTPKPTPKPQPIKPAKVREHHIEIVAESRPWRIAS